MTYEEARKALAAQPNTWGNEEQRLKHEAQAAATAFILTDIAQSLSNIASALHSIDAGRPA